MTVAITSQGHTATFQLYDSAAARDFHAQLPLMLPLSNFRDAQWMFYPPQKLGVTAREAYHDGKKGELSYYAPWGDVFMLYEDFYAGDEMHRLGVGLTGIERIADMSGDAIIQGVVAGSCCKQPVKFFGDSLALCRSWAFFELQQLAVKCPVVFSERFELLLMDGHNGMKSFIMPSVMDPA